MAVDEFMVKKIAFLSRLKVDEDKVEMTKTEFNKILQWVDQLKEVNTEGLEPLVSVNENNIELRQDEITDGGCSEEVLANAPMKEYGYFAVPKVIE